MSMSIYTLCVSLNFEIVSDEIDSKKVSREQLATFPNRTRKPQSSGYTEASWIRGKARREDQKKQVRGWLNGVARGGRCEQARQGRGGGGGGVGNRSIR